MPETTFQGRRAVSIENQRLRVTVLREGGHIAEILEKSSGVNPLWIPPWPSIEPSAYDPAVHQEYGSGAEAKLLAGLMGHNLCLDVFGGPSAEEFAAGIGVHGEGSVARYEIEESGTGLTQCAAFPLAQLRFERRIDLEDSGVHIRESVENLTALDRPIAWTQHVTLGPPFLERGVTQFRLSATKSKVFEGEFGTDGYLQASAEFDWPMAPGKDGSPVDLRQFTSAPASSAYTTHLMDPRLNDAFFLAWHPGSKLAFGYRWKRADFPWTGIWEENHSRLSGPWDGRTLTRGLEFGVSPIPESRREMIDRRSLFGVPSYRWLPAATRVQAEYWAVARVAETIPETL